MEADRRPGGAPGGERPPAAAQPAVDDPTAAKVADAVNRIVEGGAGSEQPKAREKRKVVGRVVASVGRNRASLRARGGVAGWMVGAMERVAPHLKVRDLETLRAHYHGLTGEALADSLVENAARASAVVGGAGGALAAVEYTAPPTLLSAPVQVVAETLVISAIELKLVAELHEVYQVQVDGNARQRGMAFLQAWGQQRGISPLQPGSVSAVLGASARRELRQRLLSRLGRNLTTLGPLLTGAVAGAYLNRRGTKRLADAIRNDLRGRTLDLD